MSETVTAGKTAFFHLSDANMSFYKYLAEQFIKDGNLPLFDQLQFFSEHDLYVLLTEVEKNLIDQRKAKLHKDGADASKDVTLKLFTRIRNCIFQCAEQTYIVEQLKAQNTFDVNFIKFTLEENDRMRKRLELYETTEQMISAGTLEVMVKQVREKMQQHYNHKKQQAT
jgi:hypothetical protein